MFRCYRERRWRPNPVSPVCDSRSAAALGAPKTDIVVFHNGDRLTGEVKGLDRGQLRFSTDAVDTVSIEWARLVSVDSRQILQVELTSGLRYTGQVFAASGPGKLRVAPS